MDQVDDNIISGIRDVLEEPKRDFKTHPLTQPEVMAVIEIFTKECLKTDDPDLELYYRHCVKFLKDQILWN